jgi:Rieske Fe-S protein
MGMTHSAVAALMMPALVAGKGHPWERVYDPSRKPTTALGGFLQHNLQVAADYADHVRPADPRGDVRPGEGRVVRVGGRLLTVSRDEEGTLHARSAVCTHLGCTVRWNTVEKSWDCPCHGSRFARDGEVLNAPADRPLAEADEGDAQRAVTPADGPAVDAARDDRRDVPGRSAGGPTAEGQATTDRPPDASTQSRPTSPR